MKSLKYLIIFILFVSCGYTPIYQTDEISKFKLGIINYSGDKKIGRSIFWPNTIVERSGSPTLARIFGTKSHFKKDSVFLFKVVSSSAPPSM